MKKMFPNIFLNLVEKNLKFIFRILKIYSTTEITVSSYNL